MDLFGNKKYKALEQKLNEMESRSNDVSYNPFLGSFALDTLSNTAISKSTTEYKAMKVAAFYRGIDLISNAIASLNLLPMYVQNDWKYIDKKNPLYNILTIQPNRMMGKYTFFKRIVMDVILQGNAYIYIDRDKTGSVKNLYILNPYDVKVEQTQDFLDLTYTQISSGAVLDSSQVIHILNQTSNGWQGLSVLSYANLTINTSINEKLHSDSFYAGSSVRGILKPQAGSIGITPEKAALAKANFSASLSTANGGNGVIVLGDSLEYQSINISPKDAQVLESQAFSILEIARFLGVSPALLFAEGQKYNTAEQQNLDFFNSTVMNWTEKIENEFMRKIIMPKDYDLYDIKFDISNLYKTDLDSQGRFYTTMFGLGVFTINDIRNKININASPVAGGNEIFVNVQSQSLKTALAAPVENKVDNKIL